MLDLDQVNMSVRVKSADSRKENDETECPFEEFGCHYKGGKYNVKKHIKDTPEKHLERLCEGVKDFNREITDVQLYIEKQDKMMEDLDYRVGQLDSKFSAHLIWRIDQYKNSFTEARHGKKQTIFSPPFWSGKNGYKLAASVALFGDGKEKGEFMGVFLTIIRGEYDALLPWPFSCPVTFTLMDQNTDDLSPFDHKVVCIKPNSCKENRPFLGRPVGDRNPRFGAKKFITLKEMQEKRFVRDDIIFVRIDIDTTDMPDI